MQMPRIAFLPIARTAFDIEFASEIRDKAHQHLSQLPVTLTGPAELITAQPGAQESALALADDPPD